MSFQGALITISAPLIVFGKLIFSDASVMVEGDIYTRPTSLTNILCDGVVAEVVSLHTFSITRLSFWLTFSIALVVVSCRMWIIGIS